jgi:iron-sulfur cluster repair protein YtfE (RIC family)
MNPDDPGPTPLIHPDVTIEELVAHLPQAPAVLRRWGIVCVQCGEPVWGTLKEVAATKGITNLDEILRELRAAAPPQLR